MTAAPQLVTRHSSLVVTPPCYPARPVNGGPLEKALPKSADYDDEAKYNGWRAWVHTPTRLMFNRQNEPLSIGHEFSAALDIACRLPFEWLDTEALERRHKLGQGSLIVLDTPIAGTQRERKAIIRAAALGNGGCREHLNAEMDVPLANHQVYLPLTRPADIPLTLFWSALKSANVRLGCPFYEGVVAKRADSAYPMQLRSAELDFPFWMKHRWAF